VADGVSLSSRFHDRSFLSLLDFVVSHFMNMVNLSGSRSFSLLQSLDSLLLVLDHFEKLVQVHVAKHFKLTGFGLKLFQLIAFATSHLGHLLLVSGFKLDLVFQALYHLFLSG
jgi:hypothetical protein